MKKLLVVLLSLYGAKAMACASCGCSLNAEWDEKCEPGYSFGLRFDSIDQSTLRQGVGLIQPSDAAAISNNGNPQEVEKFTTTTIATISLTKVVSEKLAFNLDIPYIMRNHSTLGTASDGYNPGAGGGQYNAGFNSLGDVRASVKFGNIADIEGLSIITGLKFATGDYTLFGMSSDPTAPGPVPIDRGLQPGTGTTDALLGVNYKHLLDKTLEMYEKVSFQSALNSANDYRPGDQVSATLGLRDVEFRQFMPQLQLNAKFLQHDTGDQADPISTGGTLVYVSPGFSAEVSKDLVVFAFVQLPVYQYVEGVQLTPDYITSVGLKFGL